MNPVRGKSSGRPEDAPLASKPVLCPGCRMKSASYINDLADGKAPIVEDCGDMPGCAACPRTCAIAVSASPRTCAIVVSENVRKD